MDSQTDTFKKRDPFKIINQQKQTVEDDFIQSHEFLTLELARGCQFKCRFCSYPGIGQKKGTYLRNFEHVKTEILYNYERWGTTSYFLTDDTVNEDQDKIIQLANFAQSLPFKLQWIGYNRLDLVGSRAGAPQILKDSGLISTFFGIESFNSVAAKAVGKPWNSKYGKSYLDTLAREWGDDVTIHCSLIVGLPGDSPKHIIDDNEWFRNSGVKSWYHNALFLNRDGPVCEFDREAEKYGYSFTTQFIWSNEFFNLLSAKKLCARITHENREQRHTKIAGWSVGEYASNNILTVDQAHKTSVYDIPHELIISKAQEHVGRYVDYQLNKATPY